jgi:D-alanyl-D-alanine carboxypeptidase/D-alanyl-D-alanine-endopeptidase (penicillin-binding protein 4)
MRMRYTAPLLAAVVTLVVVVAVLLNHGGTSSATEPAGAVHPVASASPRAPALNPLATDAPAPVASDVTRDLASAARNTGLGDLLDGEVVDASTGTVLWARGVGDQEPPASTTKLLTATAALLALGPGARLPTTAVRHGSTVYLVGGGDVTLVGTSTPKGVTAYPRPASLADLARQTAAALGTGTGRVRLRVDASAWSGPKLAVGWSPSYVTEGDVAPPSALEVDEGRINPASPLAARSPSPALQAGQVFAGLLQHDGVRLRGRVASGLAPTTATSLGAVQSSPVAQLVQRMLTTSDDDLAEALGRAVAIHDHDPADFTGAARAVTARVTSIGVPADSVSLRDTSGLSHRDRLTARSLVVVLQAAIRDSRLRPVIEGLPVAGLTGTLAERYGTAPASRAAGVLRAKTGTLTGVNTLAGEVVDRSGRLLLFAFLAPHAPSAGLAEAALDGLAARLVRCGCGVTS